MVCRDSRSYRGGRAPVPTAPCFQVVFQPKPTDHFMANMLLLLLSVQVQPSTLQWFMQIFWTTSLKNPPSFPPIMHCNEVSNPPLNCPLGATRSLDKSMFYRTES